MHLLIHVVAQVGNTRTFTYPNKTFVSKLAAIGNCFYIISDIRATHDTTSDSKALETIMYTNVNDTKSHSYVG